MGSRTAGRVLLVVGAVVALVALAAGAAAGGFAVTVAARHRARPAAASVSVSAVAAPAALGSAAASPGALPGAVSGAVPAVAAVAAVPDPGAVSRRLAGSLTAAGLGARVRASVVDVATGTTLLDHGAAATAAPASTAKLLTALALLTVRAPTERLTTTVVSGGSGAIVLVGGGDPTLSAAAPGRASEYTGAARIADLAAQVRAAGVPVRRVVVDDALFTGPAVSTSWAPEDVPSEYASAITPVLVDGGRATPGAPLRSAAPDLAAGRALAVALGRPTLPVSRGAAPAGATRLAVVRSAPLSVLVEQMLQLSDNVIAECLGRQVAIAAGQPATFTGAAAAIRAVLRGRGIDPGAGMQDASGLSATDRISARTLTSVLRTIARPLSGALHAIIAALPVGGWSGTLTDRFVSGPSRAAAGLVRAKTGTLTGVSALAGIVHDRSGRLLAFAVIADRTGATPPAEAALDDVAAGLASCGCT